MSINITDLSKFYGSQKAVDSISFSAGKGEIVGFLGPNGAGKSTTMKMITGYLLPDAGKLEVCGMDVQQNKEAIKARIGYLPESNPLYYDMYVREYLGFLAGVHGLDHKKDAVERVIKLVGLQPEAHKKNGQLSKGYKQRVGLAAALLHDPEVLILDEPTNGLDPNQIIEIREVIKTLGKEKTILMSSHIMQEVEALCERIIIINKGKIVADQDLNSLRSLAQNASLIEIRFSKNIKSADLEKIQGVQSVSVKDGLYKITSTNAEITKKEILKYSLASGIDIDSIQNVHSSLQDIFKQLTTQDA